MEFIDLKRQQEKIKEDLDRRIAAVLSHGKYIMGPEVRELEEALCQFTGAKYCIACSSGSMALELVLSAWGIGKGDAVFTTPLSFIATAEVIARLGAIPIFVDIDAETYNMDPKKLENAILAVSSGKGAPHPLPKAASSGSLRPKAILPVDLFGDPADYDAILPIAKKHDLLVLEDGAQGLGSTYKGKKLCNCGCHAAATSFFPAKPLGCYGDGGAIFTNDGDLAKITDSLRYHGRISSALKNDNVRLGFNGRMDTLQAAILMAKLAIFPEELEARARVGQRYVDILSEMAPTIGMPKLTPASVSNWAQFTIRLPEGANRSKVMERMAAKGIPAAINYPHAMHTQKCMSHLGYSPEDFPNALHVTERVLSLPMHPYLTENEQDEICNALMQACKEES